MSREISKAESWETVYSAFNTINFTAFDYDTVKESMLDYIKLYFPENFNDFIESSEFIAILELFAYLAELLAYRIDMNAHENFISTAQRKQSILRLAKLVSYNASRNIPARGLVKITSVQTTDNVYDSRGTNLINTKIRWNDTNNPNWKEQFFLVMNRVMQQDFGTVSPTDRVQIDDVLFELYSLNNNPINNNTFSYSVSVAGNSYPMELVPISLDANSGPIERRPSNGSRFSIVYGSDGLGDTSDTTGFFMFTKQGTLQYETHSYDGIIPNQTTEISVDNINETDIWINEVNPDTGETILDTVIDPLGRNLGRQGEWNQVDIANVQNILFNTNLRRNKYEVETLENDNIRIIYGDGEFADIPSGTYHIWFRTSANEDLVIPRNAVVNQSSSFTYQNAQNVVQTFTFEFSLINSLTNAAPSEDLEHIRRNAPSVYYTQDRMVNARDYNTFMLQDSSIVKMRTVNRTFSGDSKYLAWHDPSEHYENVKLFGDDLVLFYRTTDFEVEAEGTNTVSRVINNFLQPLLVNDSVWTHHSLNDLDLPRREFTTAEKERFTTAIDNALINTSLFPIKLAYVNLFTSGYQDVDVGNKSLVSATGLNTSTVYTFDIDVDSSGIQNISITTPGVGSGPSGIIIYSDLITLLDIELVGATATMENGKLRFTSETVGDNSSIDLSNIGANPMFTAITGFMGFDTAVQGSSQTNVWEWLTYDTTDTMADINGNTYSNVIHTFEIDKDISNDIWTITYKDARLLCESSTTKFWFNNQLARTVTDDSLDSQADELVLLKANVNRDRDGVLDNNVTLNVIGEEIERDGLPNIHQLRLITTDINGDSIPDDIQLDDLMDRRVDYVGAATIDLTQSGSIDFDDAVYVVGYNEIEVWNLDTGNIMKKDIDWEEELLAIGTDSTQISILTTIPANIQVRYLDYVYYIREIVTEPYLFVETTPDVKVNWYADNDPVTGLYARYRGRSELNFGWFHRTPRFNLVDPSTTNIHDMFIISRGYNASVRSWLADQADQPTPPTPLQLQNDYGYLLDSAMLSDTVILHPGQFKILFGTNAPPELQAKIKVIRTASGSMTDNEVKVRIVNLITAYFNITKWEFGETFYFSELASVIHADMPTEVDSVVLVPLYPANHFGDLMQVIAREDEMFVPSISVSDITIVSNLNATTLRQISA